MDTHLERECPECEKPCYANFIDIGVGYLQMGPFHCRSCSWTQYCPVKNTCIGTTCVSYASCGHILNRQEKVSLKEIKNKINTDLFSEWMSRAIKKEMCVQCGAKAINFKDELSAKEYSLTGLCQECQNVLYLNEGE